MRTVSWTHDDALGELKRLTKQGVLSFADQFEATEIVGFPPGEKVPLSIFTLFVTEDRQNAPLQAFHWLNDNRIAVNRLAGWKFGVAQYHRAIGDLILSCETASRSGILETSGHPLRLGDLRPVPSQFVPPDGLTEIPWNRVLKNNFSNGSYVFEWVRKDRAHLEAIFSDPRSIRDLSDAVLRHIPLRLASFSDRIGNFVVQVPVTVLMSEFQGDPQSGDIFATFAWNPQATPRPIRATCELTFDNTVTAYVSHPVDGARTRLAARARDGIHRGILWDDENAVILADTGPSAFIQTVMLFHHVIDPEPRIFSTKQADGSHRENRVQLTQTMRSLVGEPEEADTPMSTRRRMYEAETSRLTQERRFVQYRPTSGQQDAHERALGDLRALIANYGDHGAWLWDPYLSASDILQTLFHCPHGQAELRALTAGQEWVGGTISDVQFTNRQRAELENSQSNYRSLRLEYRIKIGSKGWGFHDRFLIFPESRSGPLAWSLGTSVNSFGKQHHILQRVDDRAGSGNLNSRISGVSA